MSTKQASVPLIDDAPVIATPLIAPEVFKVRRAHEVARQNVLRREDRAKSKLTSGCTCCRPWKWRGSCGRDVRQPHWDAECDKKEALGDGGNKIIDEKTVIGVGVPAGGERPRSAALEVNILDLVRSERKKDPMNEYEVVPRVRAVMVLDNDHDEDDDTEHIEKDWEYVDEDETEETGKVERKRSESLPSYADVLRS